MSKTEHFQLAARFCVTIRLMSEGPSNRLAGAGLKTTFRCCASQGRGGERRRKRPGREIRVRWLL